jgi:hypothetical protein
MNRHKEALAVAAATFGIAEALSYRKHLHILVEDCLRKGKGWDRHFSGGGIGINDKGFFFSGSGNQPIGY